MSVRLFANLNHAFFHLNDKTCKQKQLNGTHIIFQFKLNECGTINQTYKGSIIYINFLHGYVKERNSNYSKNFTKLLTTKCQLFDNVTRNASDSVRHQDHQNFGNNKNFVDIEEEKKLEMFGKPTMQSLIKPEMQLTSELDMKLSIKWEMQTTVKLSAEGKGHTSRNRDLVTPMPQALVKNEGRFVICFVEV